jgi:signal transduction histidine kinase
METVTRQLETVPQLTNALVLPASVPTGEGDVAGINRAPEIAELAELHDTFVRQAAVLRSASGPYAELAAEHYPVDFTEALDEQSSQGLATGAVDVDTLLGSLESPEAGLAYITYRDEVADALQARVDELNAAATARKLRFGLLMTATFGSAVALTVLVSLSITRPLRSLTRQAKEMAERRLPDAVADILDTPLGEDVTVPTVAALRVNTRDEVADVADALNKVQDSALDLAVEQAVLRRNLADSFVNLGRRNQNLLGRQLDFITELESNETEPDTLASLFRLDHLATRMRRNAESLLVLAGIEPPRQWAAPVRMTDVIRAALGEVESYDRVTVRGVEPATVQGSVAADLAHLLAELIENALAFSPLDRSVDIHGAAYSERRPGGYTLAVVDAGVGMPPDGVAAANRRLAGVESFTVAPSKYLGHYVAGNLAARHGIGVHLDSAPDAGVTATVELPPSLLTTGPDPLPAPAAPPRDRQPYLVPSPAAAPWPGGASPPVTAGGLVRRDPHGSAVAAVNPNRPPTAPTDAQLASLTRIAGRDDTHRSQPARPAGPAPGTPWTPGPSSWPPRTGPLPVSRPRPDAPPSSAPGPGRPTPLTRRRPGAQLPATTPISLRRTPRDEPNPDGPPPSRQASFPPAAFQPPPVQPPPRQPSSMTPSPVKPSPAADEVYGFLSSFTAGVQRGLQATRDGKGNQPSN